MARTAKTPTKPIRDTRGNAATMPAQPQPQAEGMAKKKPGKKGC